MFFPPKVIGLSLEPCYSHERDGTLVPFNHPNEGRQPWQVKEIVHLMVPVQPASLQGRVGETTPQKVPAVKRIYDSANVL